jgi:hypothetical protein
VTHEVNNRLATLGETLGLLGDLLATVKGAKGDAVRECLRAAAGLEPQLAQLAEINRRLGRFADVVSAAGPTDTNAALDDLLALTDRLARQRQVRVERAFATGLPRVAAEAGAFLLLAHHLVLRGYGRCAPGGVLRVATAREGDGVALRVAPAAPAPGGAGVDDAVRALAAAAGAQLEAGQAGEVTARFAASG